MQYLTNQTRERLLGISHEAYAINCKKLGTDYDTNSTTKYRYALIKHPTTDVYALEVDSIADLPEIFRTKLDTKGKLTTDGWFPNVRV